MSSNHELGWVVIAVAGFGIGTVIGGFGTGVLVLCVALAGLGVALLCED